MVQKLDIETFLNRSEGCPIIDVRAPAEYSHAHIPGAISLPLFSDDERAIIGTLYKEKGREAAMMKGLEFYGPNMQELITALKKQTSSKQLFVHCWRGGMRSGVVAWMLDLFGYQVSTLNKGYKAFRNTALHSFAQPKNMVIIGGKTGSAKTEVIKELFTQHQQAIDLEGMAHHKGSAFGALGELPSPTQEQFENDLFTAFRKSTEEPVWLEDESQRIGPVNLPNLLWGQMRAAPVIYLEIPFETRLDYLVQTYGHHETEDLKASTLRIRKRLGGLETSNAIRFLETGDLKSAFAILLHYYDKIYTRATAQRDVSSIHKIESNTVDAVVNTQLILNTIKKKLPDSLAAS